MPCIDPTTFRKLQGASLEAGIYDLGKAETLKELWEMIGHLFIFFNPKDLYNFFFSRLGKKKKKALNEKRDGFLFFFLMCM